MDGNNYNNIQNNQKNVANNNEKKGRGLFYFVVAFAIIIISVVGATYAYFTASQTTGEENSVTAGSTSLTLGLETDSSGLNNNLIPVSENIAKYGYAEQLTVTYYQGLCKTYATDLEGNILYETEENGEIKVDEDGNKIKKCAVPKPDPNSTCIDDSGSEICSSYTFSVINNNSSPQTITMYLGTTVNDFENLWFMVYTESNEIDPETKESKIVRTRITDAKPVMKNSDTSKEARFTIRADKENDQTFKALVNPKLETLNARATYTIVLFIKELMDDDDPANDDQTIVDGNKTFTGYVRVTSGDGAGVTGFIDQAGDYDDVEETVTSPTSPTSPTSQPETTSVAEGA